MALSSSFIQQMYVAYFGRPADPGGLAYYATFDEQSIVAAFANSPESIALYGGASAGTSATINAIYQNLFNRAAEPAGLAYWAGLVGSGQITAAGAALVILRGAANDDATTIANKVTAANLFTAHVDTTAEIAGYAGATSASYGRAYLQGVTTAGSLTSAQAAVDQAVLLATGGTTPGGGFPNPGQSFALTAGADTVAGTAGNDTITSGTAGFFGTGDSIDGGAGADTLTVTGETTDITGAGITVTNVETASLTTSGGFNLDTTGWTGLTSLTTSGAGPLALTVGTGTALTATGVNLAANNATLNGGTAVTATISGVTTGSVTVGGTAAPTGAVNLTVGGNAASAHGAIAVTGGTTVNVTQTSGNAANTTATLGAVTVTGRSTTTAVTVVNAAPATADLTTPGVTANSVTVNDVNRGSGATTKGTIGSVTVSGYTALTVNDNALASLSLTNGSGAITINNASSLTSGLTRTLNLRLDNVTGGAFADANVYTTLNITTANNDSTLANITDAVLTAVNVAGSKTLTLSSTAGLTALQTLTVSGSASVVGDFTGTNVSVIDTTDSTGKSSITLDGVKTTFTGGSGADTVILNASTPAKVIRLGGGNDLLDMTAVTATPTATIDGGTGTDTLKMTAAFAASESLGNAFAAQVSGFEQLTLTGTSNQTIDLAQLQTGGFATVETTAGTGLTLNNFASGNTLSLTGAATAYTVANGAFTLGTNDIVNVKLSDASGAGVAFASTGLTATDVETVNITTVDGRDTPTGSFNDTLTLLGNSAKVITVAGNAGLSLTAASTALTSVDASGITLGGFSWTSGSLVNPATVKGSATGTNTVNLTAAGGNAITYTGGTGNDTLTVGAGANAVNVGTGSDRVNITAANAASNTVFTTITGFSGAGDVLGLAGVSNANALGTKITALGTLAATLNAAAVDVAGTTNTVHWFNFDGDTYVVSDRSNDTTFTAGTDVVVKLTGLLDLSTATVAAGVLSL